MSEARTESVPGHVCGSVRIQGFDVHRPFAHFPDSEKCM